MGSVVHLGDPRQQLDVRMNMAFPALVNSGFDAARMMPVYSGCGAPGARCRDDQPLPVSVEAMRDAVRGVSLGGLLDAYLGEVSAPTRMTYVTSPVFQVIGALGAMGSAYHGYKRTGSIGWTICWALLGSIAPFITLPVAFAQGFGKRKSS